MSTTVPSILPTGLEPTPLHEFTDAHMIASLVGQHLGKSAWVDLEQEHVDAFAELCGDRQWIHVDQERAADGPYGATIAHGFMMLSLISELSRQIYQAPSARIRLNYGLDRLRFTSPVVIPAKVRLSTTLLAARDIDAGQLVTFEHTLAVADNERPALVATALNVIGF